MKSRYMPGLKRMKTGLLSGLSIMMVLGLAACSGPGGKEPEKWRFEAENGILSGVQVASTAEGFSGDGYVTGFEEENDSVEISIQAPDDGLYRLNIGYRNGDGDKMGWLGLNGKPFGDVKLAASEGFTDVFASKVLLNKGENTVKVTRHWGWYDIDYAEIAKAEPRPQHGVENKLVNPNASKEALALHGYLVEQYGKYILSGQQNLQDALLLNWNHGKLPAIAGFDLIEYSPTRVANGSSSREVENMLQWHELGGIATLAWHWNAPAHLVNSEQQPWWTGFYVEGTTFDLEAVLEQPESEEYRLMISDIDAIAVQLKRLQEAGIPILWRPLHEAEGGWFWWGAKGPEPAKQLYRLLYERLTNEHGINNLIWIWNSEDPEWYPGDDVVDIVSVDSYPQPGDHHPISRSYENLVELVGDSKLVALTENGSIPDPDLLEKYEANWSWFCTWTGEFIDDGKHNSEDYIKYVLNHERVITLDEVPDYLKPGAIPN